MITKLNLILIFIIAGLLAYIYFAWKPAEIITGPTQLELDNFKAKAAIKSDSLKNALASITATRTKDSIRYASERVNSSKEVNYWKRKAFESKANLSDSLPDSTIISEQAKIIVFQDSVIEKQDIRIKIDSIYIQNLQASFNKRLAIEQQQRQLLEEEIKLQAGLIEGQKAEIRKRKKGQIIEGVVIVGLFVLLL